MYDEFFFQQSIFIYNSKHFVIAKHFPFDLPKNTQIKCTFDVKTSVFLDTHFQTRRENVAKVLVGCLSSTSLRCYIILVHFSFTFFLFLWHQVQTFSFQLCASIICDCQRGKRNTIRQLIQKWGFLCL